MQQSNKTKNMILMALFAAIAYILVALIRIPAVLFLNYEPKDVVITIGGFLLGPFSAFVTSLVVSLVEMVTISQTGLIGCVMNLISTCSFACVAALIYKHQHSLKGAIWGLLVGSVSMIITMLLWNWLIAPLYMENTTRQQVASMLVPVFLPFNALKAGLNSALILGLYKPLTQALRKARLLPPSQKSTGGKLGIYLLAGFLLTVCILLLLVMQHKI